MRIDLEAPLLRTSRLTIRMCKHHEAGVVTRFFLDNAAYLQPWWPTFTIDQFTESFWRRTLMFYDQEFKNGRAVKLFLFEKTDRIIGLINLNQLVRGVSHSAVLGYGIAAESEGQGLMTEAINEVVAYAFGPLNLHRLTANYIPENIGSGKVLEKAGFIKEGYVIDYLMIDGKWQDHILTGLNNPNWKAI